MYCHGAALEKLRIVIFEFVGYQHRDHRETDFYSLQFVLQSIIAVNFVALQNFSHRAVSTDIFEAEKFSRIVNRILRNVKSGGNLSGKNSLSFD